MQPATRTSKQPLGGISGGWRRRLLRFHVPLALASALVLVLFVTLPTFDASAYPAMNMLSGTFFPQKLDMDMQEMHRGGDGSMDREAMQEMHRGGEDAEGMEGMDRHGNEVDRTGGGDE